MSEQHPDDELLGNIAKLAGLTTVPPSRGGLYLPNQPSLGRPARKAVTTNGKGTRRNATKQVGRNEPCPCGSGKKYKKCHGKPHHLPTARREPDNIDLRGAASNAVIVDMVDVAAQSTTAPAAKQATAQAMLKRGISERVIWAYLETGIFVTEQNRQFHDKATLQAWDRALEAYDNATPEERRILLVEA